MKTTDQQDQVADEAKETVTPEELLEARKAWQEAAQVIAIEQQARADRVGEMITALLKKDHCIIVTSHSPVQQLDDGTLRIGQPLWGVCALDVPVPVAESAQGESVSS